MPESRCGNAGPKEFIDASARALPVQLPKLWSVDGNGNPPDTYRLGIRMHALPAHATHARFASPVRTVHAGAARIRGGTADTFFSAG